MQNEQILNFIFVIAGFLRLIIIFKVFEHIFSTEINYKKQVMRISLYFVYLLINTIGSVVLSWEIGIYIVVNFVLLLLIALTYELELKYKIIESVITIGANIVYANVIYKIIRTLEIDNISYIILTMSDLLLLSTLLIIERIYDLKQKEKILYSEILSIIIIPILSLVMLTILFISYENIFLIISGGIVLLIINIFIYYLFDRVAQMYFHQMTTILLNEKNEALENQLNIYLNSEEKISAIKHDLKNHIFAMQKLLENNSIIELKNYLRELGDNMENSSNISSTGNLIIDSIINLKCKILQERLDVDIKLKTIIASHKDINDMDICIILGNLFDNATEALSKHHGYKELILEIKEDKKVLFIKMKNTFNGDVLERNSIIQSSKENPKFHGFGLRNIKNVVDKYNGITQINYDSHYFNVEILMYL